MTKLDSFEIDEMRGIGTADGRTPQATGFEFPPDTVVVSPDSHWLEGDIWVDRFPEHLKDKAPRMTFSDGAWHVTADGKHVGSPESDQAVACFETVPGFRDFEARIRDLDAEGVDKELLFPQRQLSLLDFEDLEIKQWTIRAYNQYLAEVTKPYADRLYGVAVLQPWEPEKARDSVAEIKDLGFKTMLLPGHPGLHADGEPVSYVDERMDPLWSAIADSGLPVCFHIGEKQSPIAGRGAAGSTTMRFIGGMRNHWSQLVFGGVFDRNPELQVVFVESQIHWIPGTLQEADMIYDSFPHVMFPKLEHRPSWYWHQNCFATFMVDPAGLSMLDRIGADRVMWSTDYPHNESTFGYSRSAAEAVYRATSLEDFKKIVGGTAIELFGL